MDNQPSELESRFHGLHWSRREKSSDRKNRSEWGRRISGLSLLGREKSSERNRSRDRSSTRSPVPPEQREKDLSEKSGHKRTDLWSQAYSKVQQENPNLLVAFKKYLLAAKSDSDCQTPEATLDNIDNQELEWELQQLAERKWAEVKSGPEIVMGDWKIDVKDQAYDVIRMVIAFQKIIGDIVSAEPHAALAWAGVVIILPLLLNPVKQTDDAENGLDCIAGLLVRFRLVEKAYCEEIDEDTEGTNLGNRIVELYSYILKYQISVVIQYSRASILRYCRDIAGVDEWSVMTGQVQEIADKIEKDLRELDGIRLGDVRQRLVDLEQELKCLSDVQRGVESIDMNTTLDKLLCAKYAAFDDYDEDAGSSECYGETRKEILKEIEDWAEDQDGKCIFWLSGMAGSGKSTIARTVARKFKQKDYLGASFFFKAGQKLRGDSKALFTTLADQLASVMPSLKPSICKAIENDPRISEKNPAHQWEDLIFKPLQDFKCGLFKSPVLILVIDALDECRSQRSYDSHIPIILDLFYQIKNIQNIRVRVFITSRPDLEITKKFPEIRHRNLKLDQPEDLDNTRRDISIFLTAKLREVADIQVPPFGSDWPGNDMMQKLLQKAGHLFIYATTISHFLQKSSDPNRGIGRILEGTSKSSLPTKDLDNMYTLIVQAAIAEQEEEDVQEFLKVVGSIIVLSEPLSRSSLSHLLDIDRNVIYNILKPLHSVLSIPDDIGSAIQLYHLSFHDFLLSRERCTDERLQIDEAKAHEKLYQYCLAVMCTCHHLNEDMDPSKKDVCPLKQDMCDFGHPGVLATDIDKRRLDKCLPPRIQYACRYWVSHLRSSKSFPVHVQKVDRFLRTHLLHWIEALALMGKVEESLHMMIDLQSLGRENGTSALSQFVRDAERVVLRCRPGIEAAPLQIYCSALAFAPRQSEVRKLFLESYLPHWICHAPQVDYWDYHLQTLVSQSSRIHNFAFSSNSELLFSFTDNNLLRNDGVEIWDASTGVLRDTLPRGQKRETGSSLQNGLFFYEVVDQTVTIRDLQTEIHFTVAGAGSNLRRLCISLNRLATLHTDGDCYIVKIWDLSTGLLSKAREVNCIGHPEIDLSPDGRFLAFTSMDSRDVPEDRVEIWDGQTGLRHDRFITHEAWRHAFSPDGRWLALSLSDAVQFWNTATGELSGCLKLPPEPFTDIMVFSPDSNLFAAAVGNSAFLWDLNTNSLSCILTSHDHISVVAFSPHEVRLFACGSLDGTVSIWNLDRVALYAPVCKTLEGHRNSSVTSLAFSPDGRLLASGHRGTLQLWDAAGIATTAGYGDTDTDSDRRGVVTRLASSPDNQVLAVASADGMVRLWTPATRELAASLPPLAGHEFSGPYHNLVFSPDSNLLAIHVHKKVFRVWDVAASEIGATLHHDSWDQGTALRFLPDNQILACDGKNLYFWPWKSESMPRIVQAQTDRGYVGNHTLASSPDGQLIVAVVRGPDQDIVIVADCAGNLLHEIPRKNQGSNGIAISPDKQCLAIVTDLNTIDLIDLRTGRLQLSLESSSISSLVNSVALSFTLDGQLLATADAGKIILWDLHTQEKPQALRVGQIENHEMVFSVDGTRLRTSRGVLALPGISDLLSSTVPANFAVINGWFTWKMARVLWMPYEFQSRDFLVAGNVVAFFTPSGLPIWIELDPSIRPTDEASVNRFTWEDLTDCKIHEFDRDSMSRSLSTQPLLATEDSHMSV